MSAADRWRILFLLAVIHAAPGAGATTSVTQDGVFLRDLE
jgi:hypothetical protein